MTSRRTDIHFHLLPGLDDGPATIEESVALARAAIRDGTTTIVATPHVRSDYVTDVRELRDRVREVKAALAAAAVPASVAQGGELGHDMVGTLRQDELEAIAQGPPDGRWLLVETPFGGLTETFHAATDELRDRGFAIVLAHPERSAGLLGARRASLDRELAAGAALQVNAFSVAGRHGADAQRAATELVALGSVSAIASDAHGGPRTPALTPASEALIAAGFGASTVRALVDSGPRRLLARGLEAVPAPFA
jgi:protein-tyrosine phosphatase